MTEATELDKIIKQLKLDYVETYTVDQNGNTIKMKIY
jgi:hypothetical protein